MVLPEGQGPVTNDVMTENFQSIMLEIRAQGVAQHIRTFAGDSHQKFRDWSREMQRISGLMDDGRMRLIATSTLSGPAADFVSRLIQATPTITWIDLLKEMKERYSDSSDHQFAREKLRRLRQHKGELVQNYVERLKNLAEEAYPDINDDTVQQTLIEILSQGVLNDHLARQLIRKKHKTLDEALKYACKDQQDSRTFEFCRGSNTEDEPMDVDAAIRISKENDKFGRLECAVQALTTKVTEMSQPKIQNHRPNANQNANGFRQNYSPRSPRQFQSGPRYVYPSPIMNPNRPASRPFQPMRAPRQAFPPPQGAPFYPFTPPTQYNRRQPNFEWTNDGRPICFHCRVIGHIQRFCRSAGAPSRPGN